MGGFCLKGRINFHAQALMFLIGLTAELILEGLDIALIFLKIKFEEVWDSFFEGLDTVCMLKLVCSKRMKYTVWFL